MASGIDQLYASNIRAQVDLFAAWLPNADIKIGHYGPLNGLLFQPLNHERCDCATQNATLTVNPTSADPC